MKTAVHMLVTILFAVVMAAALAGIQGCAASEQGATADLPLACDEGEWLVPNDGECLLIRGEFRLGGVSRGACHDVWDVLSEATISTPMVASGNYELRDVECE